MRVHKPAVITVRVTYSMQNYLERLALKAGLSFSDFLRMAIAVGSRHQAWAMGIFDEDLDPKDDEHIFKRERNLAVGERKWELREPAYLSNGEVPIDLEERLLARKRLLGVKE
jgi:hypothetical protein